ncbi:hypothetical protein ACIBU0_37545 [Streptomyces sp. NPDC049627]|uniref:hypothetical protein n=1 Tax=Streptomyces sp. NPDC049627 TaxID=3365595 RepID=UPI0037BCFF75
MDATDIPALPYVDEHTTVVASDADTVWRELATLMDRTFSRGRSMGIVRWLGCADRTPSGPRPLAEGSTLRGFRVAVADPGRELALIGRHRFSSYALVFRLDEAGPGQTRIRAETRARFPGPTGAVYRQLVIGTGGHAIAVRRMLKALRGRAL